VRKARQRITVRVQALPEWPAIGRHARRRRRCGDASVGGMRATRARRRPLMAAATPEQPSRVEIGLRRDERRGHAGQQSVTYVTDAGAARRAAQAIVRAVRHGLIHGDSRFRVRAPHLVHGAYLSPRPRPRLQTWKTRPYVSAHTCERSSAFAGTAFVRLRGA